MLLGYFDCLGSPSHLSLSLTGLIALGTGHEKLIFSGSNPTPVSLKVENYSSLEIITSCIHRDSLANKNRTLAIAKEIIFIRYRSAVTLDISEMHLRSQYNLQKSQSIKCTGEIFGMYVYTHNRKCHNLFKSQTNISILNVQTVWCFILQ